MNEDTHKELGRAGRRLSALGSAFGGIGFIFFSMWLAAIVGRQFRAPWVFVPIFIAGLFASSWYQRTLRAATWAAANARVRRAFLTVTGSAAGTTLGAGAGAIIGGLLDVRGTGTTAPANHLLMGILFGLPAGCIIGLVLGALVARESKA